MRQFFIKHQFLSSILIITAIPLSVCLLFIAGYESQKYNRARELQPIATRMLDDMNIIAKDYEAKGKVTIEVNYNRDNPNYINYTVKDKSGLQKNDFLIIQKDNFNENLALTNFSYDLEIMIEKVKKMNEEKIINELLVKLKNEDIELWKQYIKNPTKENEKIILNKYTTKLD